MKPKRIEAKIKGIILGVLQTEFPKIINAKRSIQCRPLIPIEEKAEEPNEDFDDLGTQNTAISSEEQTTKNV